MLQEVPQNINLLYLIDEEAYLDLVPCRSVMKVSWLPLR